MSKPPEDRRTENEEQPKRSGGRKLAEWVSFSCSALLIAAVASFLIYEGLAGRNPRVPVEIELVFAEAREENGRYILPIRVRNRGSQTVHQLVLEVTENSAGQPPKTREVTLDYLGENSVQTAYCYFDREPKAGEVQAHPRSYRLD
ncbi:MAG TPA: hypothetical protein VF593_05330 [Chthoniobacteraceae bacterium]|jgi:uncharacterized protein (TIGR02588 family)